LETYRCKSCGFEETVHTFYPARDVPPASLEPARRYAVRWHSAPTAEQIMEVRRLFTKLKEVSPTLLKKQAQQQGCVDVGLHAESEISGLRESLQRLGLAVEARD
jgi:hypothetical protein